MLTFLVFPPASIADQDHREHGSRDPGVCHQPGQVVLPHCRGARRVREPHEQRRERGPPPGPEQDQIREIRERQVYDWRHTDIHDADHGCG